MHSAIMRAAFARALRPSISRTSRSLATAPAPARKPATWSPTPQTLDLGGGRHELRYIDLRPTEPRTTDGDAKPTFVFIHGAPGSFMDFRHLIPLVQDHARVIGIDLPGNGGSQVHDEDNFYDHVHALSVGRAAFEAVTELCGEDPHVFVVGHSFGGHSTINLAAMNEEHGGIRNLRGLVFLASAGIIPHKALQVRGNAIVWRMLRSNVALLESVAQTCIHEFYVKVLRFPTRVPKEQYVAGLARCATTDFAVIKSQAERLQHIPAFFAWARDDAYMQEEVFLGLSALGHPGPRLAFERGGHNIQKTQADVIARELLDWAAAVRRGDLEHFTRDIVTLP